MRATDIREALKVNVYTGFNGIHEEFRILAGVFDDVEDHALGERAAIAMTSRLLLCRS